MKTYTYPTVLSIAGFDGSGGAGIQADIKTSSALGCYATTILTALPIQNTTGVKSIHPIPEEVIKQQLLCMFEDIVPSAIKIGMVHSTALVNVIANFLKNYPDIPIVFDPVMVSTSGHRLIEKETIKAIKEKLFPIAELITPNMDEAAILANMEVNNTTAMQNAGKTILKTGCKAVLVKGGHLHTAELTSYLFQENKTTAYHFQKINTHNMHGSGCTLSTAIASYLAQEYPLEEAVKLAQDYIHKAIENGKDVSIGKGNGPVNHFFNPQKLIKYELDK